MGGNERKREGSAPGAAAPLREDRGAGGLRGWQGGLLPRLCPALLPGRSPPARRGGRTRTLTRTRSQPWSRSRSCHPHLAPRGAAGPGPGSTLAATRAPLPKDKVKDEGSMSSYLNGGKRPSKAALPALRASAVLD